MMNTRSKHSTPLDFEELVNKYYQPLYRFAYSLSKQESDAADLTQETFLIWAQKGHTLRDPSKVKSWLFTTLYRAFLGQYRRNQRELTQDESIIENLNPSFSPNWSERLDARQAVELMDTINPVYRAPLTLFYLQDLSYKEIAEILGIPIGTVMSRLSRGKAQLKQKLSEKAPKDST